MKTPLSLVVAIHLVATSTCIASETINVTDFGVHPNSRENAVAGVKKALEACREVEDALLVFPKGRYDFWPQHAEERVYYESNSYDNNPKTCAILMEDFKGLAIDGSGSEFVFHGRMQPLTVERCERVTIRNLTIDWDIPLTAQGELVEVGEETIDGKPGGGQFTRFAGPEAIPMAASSS